MLTKKGALIELAVVVAGVLIALSVDTVREWRGHQALATEARANLLNEVRQNKKELDNTLENFGKHQENFRKMYGAVQNLLADKPIGTNSLNVGFGVANLTSAAYATAEVTGAFAYMDYAEVRAFAEVYDIQRKYDEMQEQSMMHVAALSGPLLLAGEPTNENRTDLERMSIQLQNAVGQLGIQKQVGDGLTTAYAKLLAGR